MARQVDHCRWRIEVDGEKNDGQYGLPQHQEIAGLGTAVIEVTLWGPLYQRKKKKKKHLQRFQNL